MKFLSDELERTGLIAVKEIVNRVGGWPVLEGSNWKEWDYTWEEQLARVLNRSGLDQPKWGVGSRWPYLMGPDDPMLKNYTHLMTLTAKALGAEPKLAEKEMYEAMELELKLHILSTTPKRIIANYITWRLVQGGLSTRRIKTRNFTC
ncbi:unnamed protein product [Strongylus vulgaris]|uniref:Peptidase M13 N-terminal domain-containing protein n=1 Tax=Strongylus vulgaris TaxID=40348 RepID=A0A3P7JLU5_STRVU|nr:unnamed protein product [Strongylus vulgaris]